MVKIFLIYSLSGSLASEEKYHAALNNEPLTVFGYISKKQIPISDF